jgi:threonylcarbamoyladenosine tRNA methylthiotransferase MtaB
MAGYPGETEQDFQDMYTFLEGLPVAYLHVFSCSVRPGTLLARQVAAKTRRIVPSPVAAARARQLALLGEKKERQFASACIGQEMSVLFEEIRMSGDGKKIHAIGYSPNYLRVSACVERQGDPEFLKGMECRVRIEGIEEDLHLTGSLLF